ncbi:metalloendopeptidase [Paraoerskovia sediminicola]|uniref:Metalloendopeptidase n=1 Tax=Paraoerskovia sediminicola TaxID=1138587 RepID=A0ABN6X7U3_9CELL|nr:M23 family metallopeptidase [Paraoerskovia sediminicola]BDZ40873.1 metalloendopeptidase [Paraoerskovia sediminicola]
MQASPDRRLTAGVRSDRSAPSRGAVVVRRGIAAVVVAVLTLFAGVSAHADELDDRRAAVEREQQQKATERKQIEAALEDTDSELAQAALDLNTIEARLPAARLELAEAEAEVERTEREAEQLAQRLQDAQDQETQITAEIEKSADEVAGARSDLAEMARQAFRGQGGVTSLGIVSGAQNADDFVDEYAAVASAARSTSRSLDELSEAQSLARNRSERLRAIRETIADLKDEADQNVIAAQKAKDAAAARKAEIEDLIVQQQAKKATIEERKKATLADLEETKAAQEAVTIELKAVIADQLARDERLRKEREAAEAKRKAEAAAEAKRQAELQAKRDAEAKKNSSSGSSSGGSSSGGSSSGGSSSGGSSSGGSSSGGSSSGGSSSGSSSPYAFLRYPISNPYVTSSFGNRFHPVYHEWRLHGGTDFRAACGSPVKASASGTVLYTRYIAGGGNQMVVDHGFHSGTSVMTGYKHLSRYLVSPGQRVSAGQTIALSGNTGGASTGCHLHFEVFLNGDRVNPMSVL